MAISQALAATARSGEFWDVLDPNGIPTGRTVQRRVDGGDPAASLRPGEYHRVVVVCPLSTRPASPCKPRKYKTSAGRPSPTFWR